MNTQTPTQRSGGCSRTGRWFKKALTASALLMAAAGAQAQISINLGANPTIDFTTTPAATEWATFDITTGSATTYANPAALDVGAQTIDATVVTTALGVTAANGTARLARHNTTGGYLVTQPTGVPMAVLMARLLNTSGGDINVLNIAYNYTIPVTPVTDEVPGQRVFWSLTGAPSSWNLIPSLSGQTVAGLKTANLGLGTWANSTTLYLLWLDDNNNSGADGAFTIDDVVFTTAVSSAITITNDPDSIAVNERAPVSFTVEASGSPQEFHWLSNSVPIAGANSATYTIPSTPFSANGAVYSCIVSNAFGPVTSAGATLTVNPDLTAPTLVGAVSSTNGADVILTFSEAMNPDPTYNDPSLFAVFETGTDYGITGVTPDTVTVNGNTITLSWATSPLGDGTNYSVVLSGVYDTSLGAAAPGNVINPDPTEAPIRRNLLLIDFDGPNNIWSWTAETNLFGTGWETVAYDDSLWPNGPGALGVNTDANPNTIPIRTATAYPTPGNSAPQFFRRHFFLPAGVTGTTLSIRHLFEDGAVVFLNGQEAGRFNVGAGALSVTTRATANFVENSPLPAPVALNTAGLVAGDNVIAVVVFQNGATSSDSIMALELVANIGTFAAGPVTIPVPPASQTVNEGANVTFSVTADGALPLTYQWFRGASPLVGETGPSLTLNAVLPSQADNYSVTVSNSFGASNSPVAVLTVTGDTTPPAFLSAIGDVNLTNITLTIVDAFGLNPSAAQNVANYSVTGPNTLTIESAVLTNGTNVILTTSPRTQYQNYTVTLANIVDLSEAENEATPASLPLQSTIVLFDYNQAWKYDETGNDLGTTWKDVAFNDSAWPSGAGFLAFETSVGPLTLFTNLAGGNGSNTVLNLTNNTLAGVNGTNITFYFRTTANSLPFDPSAPGNVVRATSYFDDGGVIYVNGAESMAFNYTNTPGVNAYTNLAIAGSTEGAGGLITSNLTGFAQANNVIAVEVHQSAINSSDIAWGMRLEALVTTFLPVAPPLTITPISATQAEIAWPDSTSAQLYSTPTIGGAWTLVPGTPTQSGGFYRMTVNTATGERYYTLRQ